jgi:hypothetical protein
LRRDSAIGNGLPPPLTCGKSGASVSGTNSRAVTLMTGGLTLRQDYRTSPNDYGIGPLFVCRKTPLQKL